MSYLYDNLFGPDVSDGLCFFICGSPLFIIVISGFFPAITSMGFLLCVVIDKSFWVLDSGRFL